MAVALCALCACHKAPARIYTDKELAVLEERVLAEVAKTDARCSHPELLEIETSVDDGCHAAMMKLRGDIDPESIEVASIDERCSAKVLEAFGRAAATSPGCSPYQVGVRGEPPPSARPPAGGFLAVMFATRILVWHALRETDHYVGLTELLLALNVAQDMGRGRVSLIEDAKAIVMDSMIIDAAHELLGLTTLTKEQLGDAQVTLDTVIGRAPSFSAVLEGESLALALHMGVAALRPPDWQPPGGRDDLTTSDHGPSSDAKHDRRDDAGELMALGLRRLERFAKACPASASLATCHANLVSYESGDPQWDQALTDKHAVRVGMFPDDETRHESQEQLVATADQLGLVDEYAGHRATDLSHLVALRLRLQVLLDGHCPSDAELTTPPWSTLRAPGVLGDSVVVTRTADALLVDAPAWATTTKLAQGRRPKPQPVSITCP